MYSIANIKVFFDEHGALPISKERQQEILDEAKEKFPNGIFASEGIYQLLEKSVADHSEKEVQNDPKHKRIFKEEEEKALEHD